MQPIPDQTSNKIINMSANSEANPNVNKKSDAWQKAQNLTEQLKQAVGKGMIGQTDIIEQVCVCLIAGGHVLIEGLPGLGKTLMVKAFAKAIGGTYHRVQFTPDLMPADITGHTLYDMQTGNWKVRRGPVFCNLLLADEINRASAKTQSALLEVMQEHQVTIEGKTYELEAPFITIATQNPLEQEGTYPLPEAQLDRFLFNVLIDYPNFADEANMVKTVLEGHVGATLNLDAVPQIMSPATLIKLQNMTAKVALDDRIIEYALQIVRLTRESPNIQSGAGPRGGIAILRASRAYALMQGRGYVIPDDVVKMAVPVLRHRLTLGADQQIDGIRPDQVINQIVASVPAPRQ